MKGQFNFDGILEGLLTIIIIVSIMPILFVLTSQFQNVGCEKYVDKINDLHSEIQQLKVQLDKKESEVAKLNTLFSSLNRSLSEKDKLISNLTYGLNKTKKENEILKEEINYYKEKKYITEIHNYFLNISNQLTEIENNFLVVELSIGLLSLSLITLIETTFGPIRRLWDKIRAFLEKRNKSR